jgi:hypothetical protein
MSELTALAREFYRAYQRGDREFFAERMAEDFTFTSPYDDHIGREEYFRRCWPPPGKAAPKFHFEAVAQDGEKVMVLYRIEMGAADLRNAECMTFEMGRLKSVAVFFGDPPNGLTRRQFAEQSGAA